MRQADATEEESDEEVHAEGVTADGDSTDDAESNQSDEDLNVHNFIAELEAAWEADGRNSAELDHMDGMETQSAPPDGEEAADVEEPEENLQMMPDGEEDSSDEEAEEAEGPEDTPMASEAEGPQVAARKRQRRYPPPPAPGAKRLNGKQRPPAAYLTAGIASPAEKVLKRPAMLKRPAAARSPYPNEQCRGYEDVTCKFNPLSPGEAARAHPDRGGHHCIFCKDERLRDAHATRRPGADNGELGCRPKAVGVSQDLHCYLVRWTPAFFHIHLNYSLHSCMKMRASMFKHRCSVDFVTPSARGKQEITKALHKFYSANRAVFNAALERVQQFLGEAVAKEYRKKAEPKEAWERHLQHRQSVGRELKEKEKVEYDALVRRDQRVARRKFFFPEKMLARAGEEAEAAEKAAVAEACGEVGHVAPNDTDLPRPSDDKGKMIENWCKHGSWGMCEKCHSMCPRKLEPMDLKRVKPATIPASQCTACKLGEYVPQPEHVPVPLRNLKPRVLEALRPLEIDIGTVERVPNGYRVHNAMMAFAWKQRDVETEIAALRRRGDRRAAREAFEFLLGSEDSAYKKILEEHQEFLNKFGSRAPLKKRKRPLRFIETEGLECCLWPHLYWHRNLCETVARASHESRKGARPPPRRAADTSSGEEEPSVPEGAEEEEEAMEEEGQQEFDPADAEEAEPSIAAAEQGRIKRDFIRKVLSPVIGYGADYDLLHFVFDLSMWTTVGTKKNLAARTGMALRHLLKNSPWTPQYWRVRHQAVLDMQRQCGNASLFRTRAPYERSFPYHEWVMHEQATLGRPRQHLAGAETLHMAHVLNQLDQGYICGDMRRSGRSDRTWKGHVLGPEDEDSNISTVLARDPPGVSRRQEEAGKPKVPRQRHSS